MAFQVPHYVRKMVAPGADYQVHMTGHHTPGVKFKIFMLLAKFDIINNNVLVFISYEQVYPVYYSKCYKIAFIAIPEFVFPAHA